MSKRIRLIRLKTRTLSWYSIDDIPWIKVWTITHPWDGKGETRIPLKGVTWKSRSFSSEGRFNLMLDKTHQVVEPLGGEYVWADAACINQESEEEKKTQVELMSGIFKQCAGTVAFGTLLEDNRFAPMVRVSGDGRKAWVCDWFERVWTLPELQLPKEVLFVSGGHVFRRDELYFFILLMSPYLTSPHSPSSPRDSNDPYLSIHDVLNAISPMSKYNAQRALMQTSRRGCSLRMRPMHDRIYSILPIVAQGAYLNLTVDYDAEFDQVLLDLMTKFTRKDALDTLTHNLLPPADSIRNAFNWSGMVMMDQPTEHPSYEKDVYHATRAAVVIDGEPPRATTVIYDAPLWTVVVTEPKNTYADQARVRPWPSVTVLSQIAKLTDDFSRVERNAEYADTVGRAERSLAANWEWLEPLRRRNASDGSDEKLLSLLRKKPSKDSSSSTPPNRLGDKRLFDREVTVMVCRSKENGLFHYGIVVTPNRDRRTWHKVCTAAFSDECVVNRGHVKRKVVIGR